MTDRNIQAERITDDLLADISGGTGVDTVLQGTVPGLANMRKLTEAGQEIVGNADPAAATKMTAASAQSYCDVCGKKTEFLVVSGGRAFCKVCGTAKEL